MSVALMAAGALILTASVDMAYRAGTKASPAARRTNSPFTPWLVSVIGTWVLIAGTWMEAVE